GGRAYGLNGGVYCPSTCAGAGRAASATSSAARASVHRFMVSPSRPPRRISLPPANSRSVSRPGPVRAEIASESIRSRGALQCAAPPTGCQARRGAGDLRREPAGRPGGCYRRGGRGNASKSQDAKRGGLASRKDEGGRMKDEEDTGTASGLCSSFI